MFKYKEKIDLTWPVEAVMQYTMVLIKGIQLVWDAGFGEWSRSPRTCFEHGKLALLFGGDAVLSWCQRRALFWDLDWGTKVQQSYLYSFFLFFYWRYFQLNSSCDLLDSAVVQMVVPAQGRASAWDRWAEGEEDRTHRCSCRGFLFLAAFVTVKTSCSLNYCSHGSHFCVKQRVFAGRCIVIDSVSSLLC